MNIRSTLGGLLLVAVMVGSPALASCFGTPTSPTPLETTTATKPYGSLIVGGPFTGLGGLDPQTSVPSTFVKLAHPLIYDSPIHTDREGGFRPGIAERWEVAPDGMTHTFYIRKGVKFHDGSDLTGADWKFSIERFLGPEGLGKDVVIWRAVIARVELKDDYTVVLHMKRPQYELLPGLDFWFTAPVPKKYIEEKGVDYFRKNPIGSGPWKFVRYIPGDSIELEAVESHWREVPKFKNLKLVNVLDEATKVAMMKTGELDLVQVEPDSVPGLKAAGIRVFSYDGGGSGTFGIIFWDLDHPEKYAFGDVRVRKALFWALDRKEIIDKLFGGNGSTYALMSVSPKNDFFDPTVLKPDPYDPEGAKRLLAEAGYANGFGTKVWIHGGFQGTLALAVGAYWQKIGVKAEMVPIELGVLQLMYTPKHVPGIWNSVRIADVGADSMGIDSLNGYHSKRGNWKNTNNTRLDELLDKIPVTADPAERLRLAREAAILAYNEYTGLRIVSKNMIVALGSKVGEMAPFRAGFMVGTQFESVTHAK